MRNLLAAASLFVCVFVTVTDTFAADAPKVDVAGGYSFLNDTTASETLQGWFASVGGYFNSSIGVAAEVGGNYSTVTVLGTSVNISEFSFMGGPKFAVRGNPKVTPFAQLLLGGARLSGSALGVSASETDFALQPGGGVDVELSSNLALRLEGDYRAIFSNGQTDNNFRFVAGIVFHQ